MLLETWLPKLFCIYLLFYSQCLELILYCHFLFLVLIGFSLFFLLCYLYSFWNQQFNGKYVNKIYKVFDLVRNFLPSPVLVKTLQTPDDLCGFPGFHCCLLCVQTDKTQFEVSCPCMLCQMASIICVFHSDVFLGACTLLFPFLAAGFFFVLFGFFLVGWGCHQGGKEKNLPHTRTFIFPAVFRIFPNFASYTSARCLFYTH